MLYDNRIGASEGAVVRNQARWNALGAFSSLVDEAHEVIRVKLHILGV